MRETLTEEELNNIDVLRDSRSFSPDSQLFLYRKRTFFWGGLVALYFLTGVEIKSANLGIISGTIKKPEIVEYFVAAIFFYYFIGFLLWASKEYTKFALTFSVKNAFIDVVCMDTLYKTIRKWEGETGVKLSEFKHSLQSYGSNTGPAADKVIRIELSKESYLKIVDKKPIPGANISEEAGGKYFFEYIFSLSNKEKQFWSQSKSYLRTVPFWEFYEYLLPMLFGFAVMIIAIYYMA